PGTTGAGPNQYWLAAKYGGFDDVNNDGKPATLLTWMTNGSSGTSLRPDNYFEGNRPDLVRKGLSQIFNRVASKKILSAAGPNVTAARTLAAASPAYNYAGSPSGFPVYATKYTPGDWTGDVSGMIATGVAGGAVTPQNTPWSAQVQLDRLGAGTPSSPNGWSTGRRMLTYNNGGVAFRWSNLSAAQRTSLNNDSTLLDYLRGDRSREGVAFRARRHLLGDIVGSEAVLVQSALSPHYADTANPGYSAFAASVQNRRPVVYVGANDGMMHAFAADFAGPTAANPVAGGGGELFAYVPSYAIAGPNGTPAVDGLAAYAKLTGFSHHFYVDQSPQVADVDFGWSGTPTAGAPDWHTLLVGGLGKGGKGIYALDITSVPPDLDLTSGATVENGIRGKVRWEFTDPDLGYTFGRPLIVKTRKYGWVVLMTSGYNNTGHGYLYVLDARTGARLEKLDTGVGTAASPSGLGRATAYTQEIADGTIEQVYAGDLLGNVWRFDLSGAGSAPYPAPVLFARLTDPGGNGQPNTTAPRIELDIDSTGLGTRRWVFVGTGKFLDVSDLVDTQRQTMYALRDGTSATPDGAGLPRTRGALEPASANLAATLDVADADPGWYYDLPGAASGSSGATERIVVDPDAAAGLSVVSWATLIPTNDPCNYQGAVYATGFDTGRSVLLSGGSSTNPVTSLQRPTAVTKVQVVQLPSGEFVLLYGETGMNVGTASMLIPNGGNAVHRVNWREVLP
ncbi:MAG TPA: PilC/PilY family type IV pilus protein, partial [Tahibacter sp.]|nr:PilC/PilY family type IV pilus protein [Tahibacter sp.]